MQHPVASLIIGFHYRIYDNSKPYFVTTTVVAWTHVFHRPCYADFLLSSLQFCIVNKGLAIGAWCLMPNHLHMIEGAKPGSGIANILRDFKRYTSTNIIKQLLEADNEEAKNILNTCMREATWKHKSGQYKLWQDGYHPVELRSYRKMQRVINYIHQNPVKAGLVSDPCDYHLSSARDYYGQKGLLEISSLKVWS